MQKAQTYHCMVLELTLMTKTTTNSQISKILEKRFNSKVEVIERSDTILAITVSNDIFIAFDFLQRRGKSYTEFLDEILKESLRND